jgi:hypothetical protein
MKIDVDPLEININRVIDTNTSSGWLPESECSGVAFI